MRYGILELMQNFCDNGIEVAMLKGMVCAQEFPDPEYRISVDTDLYLLDQTQISLALDLLTSNGFYVEPEQSEHHYRCFHPLLGLVELHTSLVNEIYEKNWFGHRNIRQLTINPVTYIPIENRFIATLDFTDHFVFVVIHAAKHFITKGLTLRRLMDILLIAHNHSDSLDWVHIFGLLSNMDLSKWLSAVMTIGEKFLSFSFDSIPLYTPVDDKIAEEMLIDTDKFYQRTNKSDINAASINARALKHASKEDIYHIRVNKFRFYMYMLFSSKNLGRDYAYAQQNYLLLPVAFVHRIFRFLFKRDRDKRHIYRTMLNSQAEAYERIELFEKLSMLTCPKDD